MEWNHVLLLSFGSTFLPILKKEFISIRGDPAKSYVCGWNWSALEKAH